MEIKRDAYLQQLIERKDNGMIKVITGIRRWKRFGNLLSGRKLLRIQLKPYQKKKYLDTIQIISYKNQKHINSS